MHHRNLVNRESRTDASVWRSRLRIALAVFIVIGGLLLIFEHRAHLLAGNTFIVALLALCVGVHFFLHRGHGDSASSQGDEK